jgi:hypothetical protein
MLGLDKSKLLTYTNQRFERNFAEMFSFERGKQQILYLVLER